MSRVPNWVLVVGLCLAGCEAPVTSWGEFGDGGSSGQGTGSSSGGSTAADSGASGGGEGGIGGSSSSSGSSSGGSSSADGGLAVTCTSGVMSHVSEGASMTPGDTCVSCHSSSSGEAQKLSIGGTVYPTAHEPTNCNGVSVAGATVVITDANGAVLTLNVDSVGNFYTSAAVATPYKASVVYNGTTLSMISAQSSGDCNSCHTAAGASGAPGRVMLP